MASTLERKSIIDSETGEVLKVIETQTNVIPSTDEPKFVKLYIDAWCDFKGLDGLSPADKDVLFKLLPVMTYAREGQIIYTNAELKRRIADDLSLQTSTITNSISRLNKFGVLKRVGMGTYQVNPELVGKGNWADIKRLRATFHVIGPDAGHVEVQQN